MTDYTTLYKLITLEMLDRIRLSMTNSRISAFFLDRGYTTYFNVQTVLSELVESGLIHAEKLLNTTYYSITPEGEETLGFFRKDISPSILEDIQGFLEENKEEMRDEVSVLADYYRNTAGEYSVRCRVREKEQDIIDLTVTVPTESQARAVCSRWHEDCQELYAHIMKVLLK